VRFAYLFILRFELDPNGTNPEDIVRGGERTVRCNGAVIVADVKWIKYERF